MAQAAYDLERFATRARPANARPRMRVAKGEKAAKTARQQQVLRMVRILALVAVLVGLVCAVLYTQAQLTEVTHEITKKEAALNEEKSLNAWLTFELDNMTSLKNIEERAAELDLKKMDNGQINYFKVEDNNGIQVKESPIARMLQNARDGIQNIIEHIIP